MRSAHLRAIALLSFGSLFACGGSSPPPPAPVTAKPASSTATPATTCTGDAIDPSALFTAHASAFGTAADAAAAFPLTFSGDVTINGKKGKFTRSIDKTRSKSTTDLPGLARADGVDAEGPWQIGGSGALLRLRPDEARSFDEWVLRREYIGAFKTGRDHARCEPSREGDRVVVTEEIPELGKPVLVFDRKTSALLATEHETVVGTRATTKYVWNDPTGHGVVWPAQTTDHGGGPIVRVDLAKPSPAAADAFAVPASRFTFTFPKSGAVTVPMKFYGSELLLKIKVGGKDATALLDSGAGISLAESGGKVAASFTPLLDFEGQSATQKLTFGLGEIPNVTIGGLTLASLPAARVPVPMFDAFGPNRPDVVLGWSLFETMGVRIDYAKSTITFAPNADALHSANAQAINARDLGDKFVVDASVGENARLVTAPFEVDTGNAEAFSLYEGWGKAHGFPGDRNAVSVMGQFSAGDQVTTSTFFRATTEVGPIHVDGALVDVSESPDSGIVAGLIGNETLAACDAAVFDLANRKVWIEGTCHRPVTTSHSWWTLMHEDEDADKDHPWGIASVAPKGSAANAGIARGDRLLSIDGKNVGLAFDFNAAMRRPLGTKIAVVVKRGSEKKSVTMTLVDPL